ncbi:unnamed protein product [Paramecium sonneborni]|uniref:Uncharacterized protein n=1 Tax=Paramecium sonneborni TaxID=65129 RepID=A0A8S1RNU4_9CILI|nr:unnamed protein product [Paramecium sonneborni]
MEIYINSGGGSYDQEGNQKKIGKWVELDEGFDSNKQTTYNREYNIYGYKIGRWDGFELQKDSYIYGENPFIMIINHPQLKKNKYNKLQFIRDKHQIIKKQVYGKLDHKIRKCYLNMKWGWII